MIKTSDIIAPVRTKIRTYRKVVTTTLQHANMERTMKPFSTKHQYAIKHMPKPITSHLPFFSQCTLVSVVDDLFVMGICYPHHEKVILQW